MTRNPFRFSLPPVAVPTWATFLFVIVLSAALVATTLFLRDQAEFAFRSSLGVDAPYLDRVDDVSVRSSFVQAGGIS